jgi:DNA-binding transcriptional ArsR family regulator
MGVKEEESKELFELHAEFCKVIASATRLRIVALLRDGELAVGTLARATGSSWANISQHLRILRNHDIVRTRKEGRVVYYRLRDARLVQACELIRSILLEAMRERGALGRRSEEASYQYPTPAPGKVPARSRIKPGPAARNGTAAGAVRGSTRRQPKQQRRIDHDA